MNKRIAKKVLAGKDFEYALSQRKRASKRLGIPVPYTIGIDKSESKDETAVLIIQNGVVTGRFSGMTQHESAKPKTAFNLRTGDAPSHLPGTFKGEVVFRGQSESVVILDDVAIFTPLEPTDAHARLHAMQLPELKELAKTMGLKGYSTLKKAEVLDLIEGAK